MLHAAQDGLWAKQAQPSKCQQRNVSEEEALAMRLPQQVQAHTPHNTHHDTRNLVVQLLLVILQGVPGLLSMHIAKIMLGKLGTRQATGWHR